MTNDEREGGRERERGGGRVGKDELVHYYGTLLATSNKLFK
jgi:hypothetical protein